MERARRKALDTRQNEVQLQRNINMRTETASRRATFNKRSLQSSPHQKRHFARAWKPEFRESLYGELNFWDVVLRLRTDMSKEMKDRLRDPAL